LAGQLAASPVPIVLDAFGWAEGGIDEDGVSAVLSLLRTGRAYVKLAEPYKLSKERPNFPDLVPLVRALLNANPERLLWGSGWPYLASPPPGRDNHKVLPDRPIEAEHLLALFAKWVPDAATRRVILVDNPARLYGFNGPAPRRLYT
jgi:predicted TIM-barrel fold metal-dependent hydrolase